MAGHNETYPKMNIQYRKLQPADSKTYRELRLESLKNYPNNFGSGYEAEVAKPKLAFEMNIEQQLEEKFIMGAFDGEKLIGICGFVREEATKAQHRGLIIQMYIQPEYQSHKFGLQLLQATTNLAFQLPDMEHIVLGVITTNIAAAKIYEQAGFIEFGLHPNYLKVGNQYFNQRLMVLHRQS